MREMGTIQKTQSFENAWSGTPLGHEPLAQHRRFRSKDLDCAREMVARKYCAHRLDVVEPNYTFDSVHNHFAAGDLSFNYMRYGGKVEIDPGELQQFYLVQIPLRGSADIQNGHQRVESSPEFATILNPDLSTRMVWHADCEMLLVQIDKERLRNEAELHLGRKLSAPIRFDSTIRMRARQLSAFRHHLGQMFDEVDRGFAPTCEIEFLLQLLEAVPSNVQCFFDVAPQQIATRQIKRGVEFIRTNFDQDIELNEIARAAGASPRALQYGFKSTYGLTPMQLLRLERLRWARHLLLTSDRRQSVTEIAMDLGFQHLGRFSQEYREAFGETPQQTVKRVNGL